MKTTFFQLPDEACERLKRSEMQSLRWCMAAMNSIALGQEDLKDRLECIPNGKVRWRLLLGQINSLTGDLIGTVPVKQCKQIQNTMHDMQLQLVPKGTPNSHKVTMGVDDLSYLVASAKKEHCTSCILTDADCRSCELYKILESVSPLEDYGDGTMCPYMKEDWWDR